MDSLGMIVGFDWEILDFIGSADTLDFFIELGVIESNAIGLDLSRRLFLGNQVKHSKN